MNEETETPDPKPLSASANSRKKAVNVPKSEIDRRAKEWRERLGVKEEDAAEE